MHGIHDDCIFIEGLVVRGKHGVYPEEQSREQSFVVSVWSTFDTSQSAQSDSLKDTVDYTVFERIIRDTISSKSYYLIERLAADIIQIIFSETKAQKVTIEIKKPQVLAPAIAGIRVTRVRAV
jgi:dihydroneopterin aldolase